MGLNQSSSQSKEDKVREDMKRRWENFGQNQETKKEPEKTKLKQNESEKIQKNESNQNETQKLIKDEPNQNIEDNLVDLKKINNITELSNEEEKPKEKKEIFLSLIPPEEGSQSTEKEIKKDSENQNIEDIKENINDNKNDDNNDDNKNDNNIIEKKEVENINEIKEEEKSKTIIKKDIDYENTTIEKVFHITLDEENPKKYLYLEFYLAKILSLGQSPSFKLENLDDIILMIMNEPTIKSKLLDYFLECFHRAYEIIEVRFKEVLGPKFSEIHLAIATYFGQIVSSPESFDLTITKKEISQIIKNYYLKTSEDEFLFLFKDITQNCGDDIDSLSQVLHYLFEIMHMENINGQTFFKGVEIRKNLNLLIKILENYPKVRQVFLNDALFNPTNVNGRLKQAVSFYGPYISNSPLDCPIEQHRNAFKQFTNDTELKSYINKLNNIIELLTDVVNILDEYDEDKSLNYFFSIINLNLDWQKTFKNIMILSSHGFLLNILYLSLNLFFYESKKLIGDEENNKNNNEYKMKTIKYINTKFCLNDNKIIFSKFNPICAPLVEDYIKANKSKSESLKYNVITKLFFICQSLMNYVLPTLMKSYMEANKAASQAFATMGFNNPKTREFIIRMKLFDIYVKNDKLIKNILEFNEITTLFIITLNNSKYVHDDEYKEEEKKDENPNRINIDEFSEFKNDFYEYMDGTSNIIVSSLPECCILNIVNSCIFFRQSLPDIYFKDYDLLKNLTSFALIYSSRTDIIHNQYLRAQIFDILLYSFHLDDKEKNNNHILFIHQKLLKDSFIKDNLIFSIMRVFIDAERLGTSNQFYERFSVRNKVLELVNEVFKKNHDILIENILNYSDKHSDDANQMLTLLMGDVSYLSDETIQRLTDIKKYQELKDNKELWNSKTEEDKKREDDKFTENDRLLKSECRLLNHSLGFMTIICSCLQKYFIKEKKAERLATLLNYCLDEFTSKSSQLKIKNKKDYEFSPSYIMESLIKIYSYFDDYETFIEFIVSDESYYKYDNFIKAIKVKNDFNKVKVDTEVSEKFDDLVYNKLKKAEDFVKKNEIDYEDAPEEFIDPLIFTLMEDPVILPSSKNNIDRKTIEEYLLTNPTDPFTRQPLTKEELIPNEELKKRIDEYKLNKIKSLQNKNNEGKENSIDNKENKDNEKTKEQDENDEKEEKIENNEINEKKENNQDNINEENK